MFICPHYCPCLSCFGHFYLTTELEPTACGAYGSLRYGAGKTRTWKESVRLGVSAEKCSDVVVPTVLPVDKDSIDEVMMSGTFGIGLLVNVVTDRESLGQVTCYMLIEEMLCSTLLNFANSKTFRARSNGVSQLCVR